MSLSNCNNSPVCAGSVAVHPLPLVAGPPHPVVVRVQGHAARQPDADVTAVQAQVRAVSHGNLDVSVCTFLDSFWLFKVASRKSFNFKVEDPIYVILMRCMSGIALDAICNLYCEIFIKP